MSVELKEMMRREESSLLVLTLSAPIHLECMGIAAEEAKPTEVLYTLSRLCN